VEKYRSGALLQPETSNAPHAPAGAVINATGVWGIPAVM